MYFLNLRELHADICENFALKGSLGVLTSRTPCSIG
jgi:hypothetical protein